MNNLLEFLPRKARRGSKPRCHWLTHGTKSQVAKRLTDLVNPWGCVTSDDNWMPQGFECVEEAQLDKAPLLLPPDVRWKLQRWWLAVHATTPNWDIASTCCIEGHPGLLLVEAKAHKAELTKEETGKTCAEEMSEDGQRNHDQIGRAIKEADASLNAVLASWNWNLSRDSHYQMSNRFAWAWKLADLKVPVILVYLGFLNASEMQDRGEPFADSSDWEEIIRLHSQNVVPGEAWNERWLVRGTPLIPLIMSRECPLSPPSQGEIEAVDGLLV